MSGFLLKKSAALIIALALICFIPVTGFCSGVVEIYERDGAEYRDESGKTGVIPEGDTVLVYDYDYETKEMKALYDGKKIILDGDELDEEYDDFYGDKYPAPQKYRVWDENGAVVRREPREKSSKIAKLPFGMEFEVLYYAYDEFSVWVSVDFDGVSGWVYDEDLVMVRGGNSTGKITVVADGVKLYEDGKAVSKVIPSGTVLEYDYFTDHYWEGGVTSYYTEYNGVKGWVEGLRSVMDYPTVCNTTIDRSGYVMIASDEDRALYSGPFGTGEKLEVSIPEDTVTAYSSFSEKTVDKKTGEVLTEYGDYDIFESDKYTDTIFTCRVKIGDVTGWVTATDSSTGFRTQSITGDGTPGYAVTESKIDAYGNKDLKGDKLFSVPAYAPLTIYFYCYNNDTGLNTVYAEYKGQYGWTDSRKTAGSGSRNLNAFSDIDFISDVESGKVTGKIPAGTGFVDFMIPDDFSEETGGYIFVRYGDEFGWIEKDADYLVSGPWDLRDYIDIAKPEDTVTQVSEDGSTSPAGEDDTSGSRPGKPEESMTEQGGETNGREKPGIIMLAASAAIIIAIAIVIINGRKRAKNEIQ